MTDISPEVAETTESLQDALTRNMNELNAEAEVANDDVQEKVEEDVVEDSEDEQPETEEEIEETEPEVVYQAPTNWTKEEKELFGKLPDELETEDGTIIPVKEILTKYDKSRNADYTRKTQELSQQRKEVEGLVKLIEPHKGEFEQRNLKPEDYFRDLMNTATSLQKDPAGTLKYLIDVFKVDPSDLGITASAEVDPDDEYLTDQELQLKKRAAELEKENARLKQEKENEKNRAMQSEGDRQLVAFETATNEDGTLKHPYFEDKQVKKEMLIMVQADDGLTLEEAYNNSPTVKRLEFEASTKETPDQKKVRKRMEVSNAKKSSMRVTNKTSSVDFSKMDLAEHLKSNLENYNNNK